LAECEKAGKQRAVEETDHLSYLLRVCELEPIEQEQKAAARRLKAAKFPPVKTATEFDFVDPPTINLGLFSDSPTIDRRFMLELLMYALNLEVRLF
jgi:DNA replication protein DnaC